MAERQAVSRKSSPIRPLDQPLVVSPAFSPSTAGAEQGEVARAPEDTQENLAAAPPSANFAHDFTKTSVLRPQAKLTVSHPDDPHEKEAEETAERVMREEAPEVEEEPLPGIAASRSASAPNPGVDDVSSAVDSGLSGGGQPLPAQTRSFMEPRFGFDFSQVRIHTDARAAQSADAIAARAYTVGSDIAFRQGDYQPDSSDGRKLLAHELTHVVQQGAAADRAVVRRDGNVSVPVVTHPETVSVPVVQRPFEKAGFLQRCSQVNTRIDLAERASRAWMLSLALAYGDAWKNHTDRLKDQAEIEKLKDDMILGSALAFVPGGVGGVVGAAMKRLVTSDFVIDGVKDLSKFGLRTAGNAAASGAGLTGATGLKAFPTDPLKWQDEVNLRLTTELLSATRALDQWQTAASSDSPDFQMNFDPMTVTDNALMIDGQRMADMKAEDQSALSIQFEKGFWTAWLGLYGYVLSSSFYGTTYSAKDNVGKKVKGRCEELGLDVATYTQPALARVAEQSQKLNQGAPSVLDQPPGLPMPPAGDGM